MTILTTLFPTDNWPRTITSCVVIGSSIYVLIDQCTRSTSWLRQTIDDWRQPWVKIGHLSQLYIHPLKSARAQQVSSADATVWGLKVGQMLDRHFMVIFNDSGKFLTARQHPNLMRINVDVTDGRLTLNTDTPSDGAAIVEIDEVTNTRRHVRRAFLWRDTMIGAYDCGDSAADWLKKILNVDLPIRLVHYNAALRAQNHRNFKSDPKYRDVLSIVQALNDKAAFQDMTPYMLANESSLNELNSRLSDQDKVQMRAMRPNLVVKPDNDEPWDEDNWHEVRIGNSVRMTNVKPCTRCKMTTLNPDTGEMNSNYEPLKTLKKYRLAAENTKLRQICPSDPLFGLNMALTATGTVNVGDAVYVKRKIKHS